MPSEEPLNIPGLPIGWKFGDPMPEGTVAEVDKPPVDESPLETVSNATNARKKRRPKQPLIFEVISISSTNFGECFFISCLNFTLPRKGLPIRVYI